MQTKQHAEGALASNPDVIVVGESLIDRVISDLETVEHPGGSPANVAYGLGRLGVDTALLTSLGNDRYASTIEKHLHSAHVELLPGSKGYGESATATVTLASDGSAHYNFNIRRDLPPFTSTTLPRALHTGSIATFLAPGSTVVRELLEQTNGRCIVTYDPNIRPALLGSQFETRSIFEELIPLTQVVKLSDEDALWLYPRLSTEEIANRLVDLGATLVALTTGAQGSLLTTRDTTVVVPSVETSVTDTIGAGDSYMSALIYGVLKHGTDGLEPPVLKSVGRLASKAAAITVGRPGALPPTLEELDETPLNA